MMAWAYENKYFTWGDIRKKCRKLLAIRPYYRKRLPDGDNPYVKDLIDVLKPSTEKNQSGVGFIVDDSPKWLETKIEAPTKGPIDMVILTLSEDIWKGGD